MNGGVIGRLSSDLLAWLEHLPSNRALHKLQQIAALLRKHGEHHWSEKLSAGAQRLKRAQASGEMEPLVDMMNEILGFAEGPGALGQILLSTEAGHKIRPKDAAEVNARLRDLIAHLFLSARQTIARARWVSRP